MKRNVVPMPSCKAKNSFAIPRRGLRRNGGRYTALTMKRDTSVNLRLTSELRAKVQRLADEDGRKLSGYIVRLLELHVREQELPDPPPDSSSTARSPNSRRQAETRR
jgi:hypothetical protein